MISDPFQIFRSHAIKYDHYYEKIHLYAFVFFLKLESLKAGIHKIIFVIFVKIKKIAVYNVYRL